MKRILPALCALLIPVTMSALPLGNPWEASLHTDGVYYEGQCPSYWDGCSSWCDAWSLRLGYYGDFVFDRHMQVNSNESTGQIHETDITTNAAYLALNFWDRFDLFSTLGATQIETNGAVKDFVLLDSQERGNTHYPSAFSWSLGLRATLWECGGWGVGAETQYFQSKLHISSTYAEDTPPAYLSDDDRAKYSEWQIGLGAAYRINIAACSTALVPYVGIKWAHAKLNTNERVAFVDGVPVSVLHSLENTRDFGYVIGMTLLGCNRASVTVEGRFYDEKALYVNGQVRF